MLVRGRRRRLRGESRAEPGTLRTLFTGCRARSNLGPSHGLNYYVRNNLPYSSPHLVSTVSGVTDTVAVVKDKPISFDTFPSFQVIGWWCPPACLVVWIEIKGNRALLSFKENLPPKAKAWETSNCRSWLETLVRPYEAASCRSLGDGMLADFPSLPYLLGIF